MYEYLGWDTGLTVFGVIIGLVDLLYMWIKDVDQKDRERIKKLVTDTKIFYENFLGWYNRIVEFTSSVISDGKNEILTSDKLDDYHRMLTQIKNDDVYFSKVHQFLRFNWKKYLDGVISNHVDKIIKNLEALKWSFNRFEDQVFFLKDNLGDFLRTVDFSNHRGISVSITKLEKELEVFEDYKVSVVSGLEKIEQLLGDLP